MVKVVELYVYVFRFLVSFGLFVFDFLCWCGKFYVLGNDGDLWMNWNQLWLIIFCCFKGEFIFGWNCVQNFVYLYFGIECNLDGGLCLLV